MEILLKDLKGKNDPGIIFPNNLDGPSLSLTDLARYRLELEETSEHIRSRWGLGLSRTEPERLKIAGIETLVVDPHNEVLPLWFGLKSPAVLVHVDEHQDMGMRVSFSYARKHGVKTIEDFSRNYLGIGSFIVPAILEGRVLAAYHLAPRNSYIQAFGSVSSDGVRSPFKPVLDKKIFDKRIIDTAAWQECLNSSRISEEDLASDLNSGHPVILDIDLDAFHLFPEDKTEEPYAPRLAWTKSLLERLPKPEVITMAYSQTPDCFVDPKLLPQLRRDCIEMLEGIYSRGGKQE